MLFWKHTLILLKNTLNSVKLQILTMIYQNTL
jgi:hypothetical protein